MTTSPSLCSPRLRPAVRLERAVHGAQRGVLVRDPSGVAPTVHPDPVSDAVVLVFPLVAAQLLVLGVEVFHRAVNLSPQDQRAGVPFPD